MYPFAKKKTPTWFLEAELVGSLLQFKRSDRLITVLQCEIERNVMRDGTFQIVTVVYELHIRDICVFNLQFSVDRIPAPLFARGYGFVFARKNVGECKRA